METEYTAVKVQRAVETLRARVAVDKIARDVFFVMSARERARNVITLGGLHQRMKLEGYNYEAADFVDILKLMASLDFGTLVMDDRGRVMGLKDITITLQSIGAAATGQSDDLLAWKPRNKYEPLDSLVEKQQPKVVESKVVEQQPSTLSVPSGAKVSLLVTLNGKPINVPIPPGMSTNDIAELIITFQKLAV